MQRVYYVLDYIGDYYLLNCATYGFTDDEEVMSSTNDIVYKGKNLIIGQYVHFENEEVIKKDDKYILIGEPTLLQNKINDDDRKTYDKEFDLSIKAYENNDVEGINRWETFLKSFEEKFLDFEEIK